MFRQGDLLFIPVDSVPAGAAQAPDGVIARGKASGHTHQLQAGRGLALLRLAGIARPRPA